MTITETNPVSNGVDVEHLLGAREALTATPAAAQFTWKASCEWTNGTEAVTSVNGFFGLGEEQSREATHSVTTDHPAVFNSADNGATPVELVLMGLAGCLTAGIASVSQNRGIKLHSVTATLEADMDLAGILGIDADVRNGFSAIRVNYEIDADATQADIEAVVAQSQKRSAVFDIVTNPTMVTVDVA